MTLASWAGFRVFMLWPAGLAPAPTMPPVVPEAVPDPIEHTILPVAARRRGALPVPVGVRPSADRMGRRSQAIEDGRDGRVALAIAAPVPFDPQIAAGPPGALIEPHGLASMPLLKAPRRDTRWSADLWLVARGGSSRQAGFGGGELGGAQAGVRIAYALDPDRRLAVFARADTAFARRGRALAAGLDWRPTRLPVRLVVEERAPLDGGDAAPAAGLVGGFGPVLRGGVRLEAYGQAGIMARNGGEGFADGAVRATRPIGTLAGLGLDLGAGAWGGAQRDAARLDLGPTLGATMPVGGRTVRLALDWRERVAGRARPGSGPALTIGASF